jgi:hypothetical protein
MQLFVEALERALRLGRITDAEQLARRAIAQVDELLAAGGAADADSLAALSQQVIATSVATNDPAWALWTVEVYGRWGELPPPDVVDRFAELVEQHPHVLRPAITDLLSRRRSTARGDFRDDVGVVARLEALAEEPALEDLATPHWR